MTKDKILKENPLSQIRKQQLQEISEEILRREFALYSKYKGEKCKKCGVIQGESLNGFNFFYCDHYVNKIERKIKKLNKEALSFLGRHLSSIIPELGENKLK